MPCIIGRQLQFLFEQHPACTSKYPEHIYVGPADGDVNREESNFISQIGSRSVILN